MRRRGLVATGAARVLVRNRLGLKSWSSSGIVRNKIVLERGYNCGETREGRIRRILTAEFDPIELDVVDTSEGCEGGTILINIKSKKFKDLSMLKQHRAVQDVIKDDIKQVHAVQLKTTPHED
eukprot:TRINITY_DN19930_c0_g1_i1.p1 TRINITY_DN19930_c0_g1~~TRINITY_DN19930_c0_g1_i1.p1  ORF type:complete len:123 (-),score=14.05 TRINITY_DN19930_c0_g1_i1:76-444(-)